MRTSRGWWRALRARRTAMRIPAGRWWCGVRIAAPWWRRAVWVPRRQRRVAKRVALRLDARRMIAEHRHDVLLGALGAVLADDRRNTGFLGHDQVLGFTLRWVRRVEVRVRLQLARLFTLVEH